MLRQDIFVTVDALVFNKGNEHLQLLLVKRKHEPFTGKWAFPGGFVEKEEELETAALRELEEETGLVLSTVKQLHTFGKVGRDPRFRTVSVVYYAIISSTDQQVAGGDDASDAQWINVKDITELAFDHGELLTFALQELRNELQIND